MRKSWQKLPLSLKLMFTQSILLIVVSALLSGTLLNFFRDSLENRSLKQLESIRTLKVQKIDGSLRNLKKAILRISETHGKTPPHDQTLQAELLKLPADYELIRVEPLPDQNAIPQWAECPGVLPEPDVFICDAPPSLLPAKGHQTDELGLQVWVVSTQPHRFGALIRLRGIEDFIATRDGLGSTGESYLVDGSFQMRTRSRFTDIKGLPRIDNPAVRFALAGKTGTTTTRDYRNQEVYSVFAPITEPGLHWGFLNEMDLDEALAPVHASRSAFMPIVFLILLGGLTLAYLASLKIIENATKQAQASWLEGQEAERSRLARDLHDGLGQLLTWQSLRISKLDITNEQRQFLQNGMQETSEELRRIVQDLTPLSLRQLGWAEAVKSLCQDFQRTTPIEVRCKESSAIHDFELNAFQEVQIYRIIQECLNNSAKHSNATQIELTLNRSHNRIEILVSDNGKGFDLEMLQKRPRNSILKSISHRIQLLDGSLALSNAETGGASLSIGIPLKENVT